MDNQFRNRLIEILVDRGLIGLLIVLFGWQVNSSLERYKLVEAQRVADSSQFASACSELWAKAYKFEDLVNESVELKTHQWLLSRLRNEDRTLQADIVDKDKLIAAGLSEFNEALATRRHTIGEPMTAHFGKYIGVVLARAQAENDTRADIGEYAQKTSREAADELAKTLASMRFSAAAAREYAISTIP